MSTRTTFGAELARRRIALDVSAQAIADLAGVHLQTVQGHECGHFGEPRPRVRQAIESALAHVETHGARKRWEHKR